MTEPVRTCIGCRERGLAHGLLRWVVVGDGAEESVIAPDNERRAPGRGAWIHPTRTCYDLARKRNAFGRALRVSGTIPVADWPTDKGNTDT